MKHTKKPPHKTTWAEKEQIIRMRNDGVDYAVIAETMGLDRTKCVSIYNQYKSRLETVNTEILNYNIHGYPFLQP